MTEELEDAIQKKDNSLISWADSLEVDLTIAGEDDNEKHYLTQLRNGSSKGDWRSWYQCYAYLSGIGDMMFWGVKL